MYNQIARNVGNLYAHYPLLRRVRPAVELMVRVGVLLIVYLILQSWLRRTGRLSASDYEQPLIVLGLLRQLVYEPWGLLGLLIALIVAHRRLWQGWQNLEHWIVLRRIILVIAGIAAWTFSTYDYNLYFNQAHYVDRLLLIALAVLIYWKPIFVFPFLWLLFAIIWQLDYPIGGAYPWTEMNPLLRSLALFGSAILLHDLIGWQIASEFVFTLFCLLASFYWGSGIGKFELNWLSHPYLHLIIGGAYSNGWLNVLEPDAIAPIIQLASYLTLPLMIFTVLIEWGAVLILLHRRITPLFLLGFIAFHTGIFTFTGMFFWKWILIEIALITSFVRKPSLAALPIYTPWHIVFSIVIIVFGNGFLFRPSNLSWYDTPLSYAYRFRGIAPNGQSYELSARTFTPYADMFFLDNFSFVNPQPQLLRVMGITPDRSLADTLLRIVKPDEVFALEQTRAEILYNAERSEMLDDLVRRSLKTLNQRGYKTTWLSLFQPPPHLWALPKEAPYSGQAVITKVQITQITYLYLNAQYKPIREVLVREINIPR